MGSVSNETGRNGGKGGKTGLVIGITVAVIVIVALIGIVVYLVVSNDKEPAQEVAGAIVETPAGEEFKEKRSVVVTEENVDEIIEQMEQEEFIEPGYFETSMTNEWHFSNGEAVSEDAYVANVPNNTNDVYFDLVLAEDEEQVIYESPVIQRGATLERFALDTPLEEGTYDCVMIYHLVDENQNTISTLRVAVKVIIEG
jgi:hypothetical protein